MYFDIVKAVYITDYKVNLTFEDGKKGVVDLKDYVNSSKVFSKFTDIKYFKKFYIEDGILTWGQGEIDIVRCTPLIGQKTG